jgi:hypothetical protein
MRVNRCTKIGLTNGPSQICAGGQGSEQHVKWAAKEPTPVQSIILYVALGLTARAGCLWIGQRSLKGGNMKALVQMVN